MIDYARRNEAVLQDFTAYCRVNPEQRFWQALRNWSGAHKVLVTDWDDMERLCPKDTFNWEGKGR